MQMNDRQTSCTRALIAVNRNSGPTQPAGGASHKIPPSARARPSSPEQLLQAHYVTGVGVGGWLADLLGPLTKQWNSNAGRTRNEMSLKDAHGAL